MKCNYPSADHVVLRYKHETTLKKVDWNQVAFPFYNGEECRKKFEQIISKVRSHRTLTEMIVDADRYVKSGRLEYDTNAKMSLKDKPRRPLTPFFMFFRDNKERVKRELGDKVTMHFMSKKLSEDFAQIPRKIRRKYEKEYRAQMEQWKIKMDEWRKNHPELLIKPKYQSSRQVTGEPIRPKPPFQHYFEDRLKRDLSGEDGTPGEGLTAEEFEAKKEHLKEKWSRLPDKKKIKYIIMSFDEEQLYRNEMKEFRKNHPDREAPKRQRSVLSKEEQRTLERAQGIPHRPPNSGWAYYSAMILKETKEDGQTPKDRLVTISEKWKDLPVHEKEYWNQEAKRALLKYYDQLERYIDGLPDDKKAEAIAKLPKLPSKRKISEIEKIMEKRSLTVDHRLLDTLSKHPIIAINAYNIYASERVTELEKNGVAKAKATKKAYKEWDSKMTLAKKAKYLKKAYEDSGIKVKVKGLTVGRKQKLDPSNLPEGCPPLDENNKILVERMRDRLPKKPPRTGYALFSQETLAKLTKDRKSMTEKMTEVGHQWSGLPKDKKDKYNHRSAEATKKHEAEMTTFLHSLSPLEYKLYEYYVRDAKTTAQEQKSTKLKDVFNTSRQPVGYDPKVSSEEEEKDSSSEEEEDDEDDKSNQKDKDDDESSSSSDDEDEFPRSSPSKPTPVKLPSLKTVSFSKPPSSPVKSSAGSSSPSKSPQSPLKIQTSFQQQAKSGKASPSKLVTSTPKPVSTPASKTSPHKVTAPAPPPPQRITVESSSAESSSESDSDSD